MIVHLAVVIVTAAKVELANKVCVEVVGPVGALALTVQVAAVIHEPVTVLQQQKTGCCVSWCVTISLGMPCV